MWLLLKIIELSLRTAKKGKIEITPAKSDNEDKHDKKIINQNFFFSLKLKDLIIWRILDNFIHKFINFFNYISYVVNI